MESARKSQISILLIEDNPADVRLIQELLKESHFIQFELKHANSFSSGMDHLAEGNFDVVLLDLDLPDSQGITTLTRLFTGTQKKLPVVVLTGIKGENVGIKAVHKGAQDYLTKNQLDSRLLIHSICSAIERKKLEKKLMILNKSLEQRVRKRTSALERVNEKLQGEIAERKQVEDQLRKLSYVIEQSPSIAVITDTKGNVQYVNPKFTQLTGYASEEVIGENLRILKSGKTPPEVYKLLWTTISSGSIWRGELINKKKNGELYYELAKIFPLKNTKGVIINFVKIAEDMTAIKQLTEEKEKLREQLYHIQKLESIGTLSGGVAHDFNNILAIITGYVNLLAKRLKDDDSSLYYLQKILASVGRCTKLIKGLLAFSRKQESHQKPVPVNRILLPVKNLLSKLIGEDIVLDIVTTNKDCLVMADSDQMDQVLMNLATNARDAMPDGGTLTITSEVVKLTDVFTKVNGYGEHGKYVLISISDTGIGMDEDTQRRIFEPFFTTKEVGKGSGLGLSIVYGIVKQHNGYINVESKPGRGTTFKIYLPLVKTNTEETQSFPQSQQFPLDGTETILLAEDEKEIRILTKLLLKDAGYRVIEAVDGYDTINKFMGNKDTIDLLLLDVIMPKKNGQKAYEEIREIRPDIKALFMSGYSDNSVNRKIIFGKGLHFISKPFSQAMLLKSIRKILDNE